MSTNRYVDHARPANPRGPFPERTDLMQRTTRLFFRLCLGAMLIASWTLPTDEVAAATERPNFVVIVADDMGFSDLGSYGSEIRTPNLDRLAAEGRRFTEYYVSISCSPTRAMLLSGRDNHVVGLGNMYERTAPNQMDRPGYEGVLRGDHPTIAEVLRDNGYRTYMTGKWHLGHAPDAIPAARGFDRSFSLLNAAGSHFDWTGNREENEVSEFVEDERYLTRLPKNYYSTRTFTDKIIDYIDEGKSTDKPFFAYIAHQAPHDPLQVPKRWLRRYKGAYDQGWDETRAGRLARMKELGIVGDEATAAARLWFVPGWDKLTGIAQSIAARKMEVYAAMVEYLDLEVGRLLDYLESEGLADNTYVLFFSDNGPESSDPIPQAKQRPSSSAANFFATKYKTDYASWGRKNSYLAYGQPWAQVSATPFYMFKGSVYEGGVRSPLIVWGPEMSGDGTVDTRSVLHVSDVAPTLLDWAGIERSALYGTEPTQEQLGRSWQALLQGSATTEEFAQRELGMEMWGGRALRRGPWKVVHMPRPFGTNDWQLFHVRDDPAESRDVSSEHVEIRDELVEAWERYARNNNVILPDRSQYDGLEDQLPPRPPVDAPDWPRGQEPNWTSEEEGR